MKSYLLATVAALSLLSSPYVSAEDSYDNTGPSSGTVSGTGAINDNGDSNGLIEGSGAMQEQGMGANPPSDNHTLDSGISRDGETMSEED